MKNKLIKKEYRTPLGTISCELSSNHNYKIIKASGIYQNGTFEKYKTAGHYIELIEFDVKNMAYNRNKLTGSGCWIWRIEKIKNFNEELVITLDINDCVKPMEFNFSSGENLDAFVVENSEWKLHVGTEDGFILNRRAENDDWFPKRLRQAKNDWQKVTELKSSSIITTIPDLSIDEKIHFQYLTAFDKQNTETINTWVAVDENKAILEKWIGII